MELSSLLNSLAEFVGYFYNPSMLISTSRTQGPGDLRGSLRLARVIHSCMIVASLFYLYVLYFLRHGTEQRAPGLDAKTSYVILLVGLLAMAGVLAVRNKLLKKALPKLRENPADVDGLKRWRAAMIITSTGPMSVLLYGWVLYFIGTPVPWVVMLLWTVSAVGFVVYFPQMPDLQR